ncbi:triose-phosphate transporter family-domain-containing protein [Geopyxis carbonaria]|nr:triose-phosphate transporter family-domain-containing protein [Geopyxis carbonaria]
MTSAPQKVGHEEQEFIPLEQQPPSSPSPPRASPQPAPILPVHQHSRYPPPVTASRTAHPAVYVATWIFLSSIVILFNKWVLFTAGFRFPIFLTTWHMLFATLATQGLARWTSLLDGRRKIKMTGAVYVRAVLPIGVTFSLSLIFNNQAYLYLSVAFIQMLKAITPVAVLLTSWALGVKKPDIGVLANVGVIVAGVALASYGELHFVLVGVGFQLAGIAAEAARLVLIEKLLAAPELRMDPLVTLYYFAPVCGVLNALAFVVFEGGRLAVQDVLNLGVGILVLNALAAFALNIALVFLIGKTSSLVLTLCGVLKDILLVAASVLIWGTEVALLQLLGYSIALGGLTYYKLGAETLQATLKHATHRTKLAWSTFTERRPVLRKAVPWTAAFLLLLFLLHTLLAPSPPSLAPPHLRPAGRTPPTPTLDTAYMPRRRLDIVVAMYRESPSTVGAQLRTLTSLPALAALNPHIIIYAKDAAQSADAIKHHTGAAAVHFLPNRGREGATYLHHINTHWNDLAAHTLFVQAELHSAAAVAARIDDYFDPARTGMLALGFAHGVCECRHCQDPWGGPDVWSRVPQIYEAVTGEKCSRPILLSYAGQFIASAARLRGTRKGVYEELGEVVESGGEHWIHGDKRDGGRFGDEVDNPYFGHSLERSWMVLLQCVDPGLAETCPRLDDRRREGEGAERCQCLDS